MNILGRGRDEKKRQEQFDRDVRLSSVAGRIQGKAMTSQAMKERIDTLTESYILQEDDHVRQFIVENFPELLPAFSRLNSTSQILKERERQILELRLKIMIQKIKMELRRQGLGTPQRYSALDSLFYFGKFRTHDAMMGYRGRLVTEEIESLRVRTENQKKKALM